LPLPKNQPCVNEIENKPKRLEKIPGLKILVVKDNAINRKLAKITLEHMEQIATFAENGELALVITEKQQFDLIFMDIHMPGISGIETSHKMSENNISTPIVALMADIFEIQ
jgi:CheY-like chemotaxis protein